MLEEDIVAWLESDHQVNEHEYFWSGKVLRILRALGFDFKQKVGEGLSSLEKARAILELEIPFDTLLQEFRRRLLLGWEAGDLRKDPREFQEYVEGDSERNGPGVTACRYAQWMGVAYSPEDHRKRLGHLRVCMPRKHHTALMRFRLGRWDLEVARLARRPGRKPRAERVCRVCRGGAVEDERHVLLECPAYEPLRRAVGFPIDLDMKSVMAWKDQSVLGSLLSHIQKARSDFLQN